MTHQQPIAAGERHAAASAEPRTERSDRNADSPVRNPYVKVFGADIGVFEFELGKCVTTIGRSDDADIRLPHRSVSRAHATITGSEGRFTLADAKSTAGVIVNGRRTESHVLTHGDSIQIAMYLLQFHTHRELAGAEAATAQAKLLLRGEYRTLPWTMRVRFRTLALDPRSVFAAGDTLEIGQGGLLIPTPLSGKETCLELHLSIAKRVKSQFLGEVMGVIHQGETHWMCVKLHGLAKRQYEAIVADAKPGPWIDVVTT